MAESRGRELALLHQIVEASLGKRQSEFRRELHNVAAELASRGLHGGPAIYLIENACLAEADRRCDLIVQLIKSNVSETTYDLNSGDLLWVFDSISSIDTDLIAPISDAFRTSALQDSNNNHQNAARSAIASKVKKARLEIEFFAGAPRRGSSPALQVQGDVGHVQMAGHSNVNQVITSSRGSSTESGSEGDGRS